MKEEIEIKPLMAPVFKRKSERDTIEDQQKKEIEEKMMEEQMKKVFFIFICFLSSFTLEERRYETRSKRKIERRIN